MSDEITMLQQAKIITGLFRISYPYLVRPVHVKPELDLLEPSLPVIRAVNLTISKI